MFNKKASVVYYDGKPIACLNIHEFVDENEYNEFKKQCELNLNELKLKLEESKNDFVKANETFKDETKNKVKDLAVAIETLLK